MPALTSPDVRPNEFLRKLQVVQKSKKSGSASSVKSLASVPAPLRLLEHLQQIMKTDQILAILHGIRPDALNDASCVSSRDADAAQRTRVKSRPCPSSSSSSSSSSAERDAAARSGSNLSKFLNLSPVMWRRWLIVERLDVICRVGLVPGALPPLQKVLAGHPTTTTIIIITTTNLSIPP